MQCYMACTKFANSHSFKCIKSNNMPSFNLMYNMKNMLCWCHQPTATVSLLEQEGHQVYSTWTPQKHPWWYLPSFSHLWWSWGLWAKPAMTCCLTTCRVCLQQSVGNSGQTLDWRVDHVFPSWTLLPSMWLRAGNFYDHVPLPILRVTSVWIIMADASKWDTNYWPHNTEGCYHRHDRQHEQNSFLGRINKYTDLLLNIFLMSFSL